MWSQNIQETCQEHNQPENGVSKECKSVGDRMQVLGRWTYVESHTFVLSQDPETIDDPSGEKATEVISLLCAFVFSVLSSSVAAREGRRRQFWPREGDSGGGPT